MRLAIVLVTAIATLMHFTVGCCLHGVRCDGVACCAAGGGDAPAGCADDRCHACDHDRIASPAPAIAADGLADHTVVSAMAAAEHDSSDHGCAGCHCAALLEARTVDLTAFDMSLTAACDPLVVARPSGASSARVRGQFRVADSSVRAAIVPPLFERLLV